jgi:hypothetical protein
MSLIRVRFRDAENVPAVQDGSFSQNCNIAMEVCCDFGIRSIAEQPKSSWLLHFMQSPHVHKVTLLQHE